MSAGKGEGAAHDATIQTTENTVGQGAEGQPGVVTPVEPTTPYGSNPPVVPENIPPAPDQGQAAQDEELRKRQEAEAQEAQQQQQVPQQQGQQGQPPQVSQPTQVQEVPQSPQTD